MNDDSRHKERDRALGDLAGRLIRAGADAVTNSAERIQRRSEDFPKASELLSGAAKLSARGKEELVTMIANEVRGYIEKLRVGEEVEEFLTSHELQIKLSVNPRKNTEPVGDEPDSADEPGEPGELLDETEAPEETDEDDEAEG